MFRLWQKDDECELEVWSNETLPHVNDEFFRIIFVQTHSLDFKYQEYINVTTRFLNIVGVKQLET